MKTQDYFFRVCDNALPAADFDCALVRPSRKTCDALLATEGDVCFLGDDTWDRALPAAAFELAPVDELLSVFDAAEAAFLPVTLVFGITFSILL